MTLSSALLTIVALAFVAVLIRRLLKPRRPTRPVADMDHEVHERIRAISAESRYSSAGIEF